MPRTSKNVVATPGKTPSAKVKRAAKGIADKTAAPESVEAPGRGVTDAELYGYPAYEYPGYDTDPDLNMSEDDDWLTADPDPSSEPLLDWGLPDESEANPETSSVGAAAVPSAAPRSSDEGPHSLLDYFAAHALNGLLAGRLAVPHASIDAAQTARLAYECAEAMVREKQGRMANQPFRRGPQDDATSGEASF